MFIQVTLVQLSHTNHLWFTAVWGKIVSKSFLMCFKWYDGKTTCSKQSEPACLRGNLFLHELPADSSVWPIWARGLRPPAGSDIPALTYVSDITAACRINPYYKHWKWHHQACGPTETALLSTSFQQSSPDFKGVSNDPVFRNQRFRHTFYK